MNPRHIKEISDRIAVAPYNFVELPNDIVEVMQDSLPHQNIYYPESENRYTGKIECTLTTESPLYIRCGLTKEEFACSTESKDLPNFFYTEIVTKARKPILPGSSLRGMIRNLIEIITFSKIELVSDKQRLFFRAVAANPNKDSLGKEYKKYVEPKKVQAGYLKKDNQGWYIQPAINFNSNTFAWVRETDLSLPGLKQFNDDHYCPQYINVSYTQVNIDYQDRAKRLFAQDVDFPERHYKKGVLITSGNMKQENQTQASPRRNHCVVFEANSESAKLRIDDTAIEHYRNALTDFQKQEPFDNDLGVLIEGRPIFYCEPHKGQTEITLFGHCPNFRIPYSPLQDGKAASAVDFIPKNVGKSNRIDLADTIFGFVRNKDKNNPNSTHNNNDKKLPSLAGRIFIENAICEKTVNDDIWSTGNLERTITPKILSNPETTTFQHYLVQRNSDKVQLKHYASKPPKDDELGETIIRGHKLYWHKGSNPNIEHPDGDSATGTQITKIKPIKPGVSFKFNINFENLNDIELGAILWILKIAAEPKYCLSLGMGKPLGMGAVKIEHELLLNNRQERYSQLFNNTQWLTGEENQIDTESKSEACIKAFENFITDNIHPDDHPEGYNATKLDEIPRIQMLLLMLRCDNFPSVDKTRYMTIEPNEYKERPVLPTPFQVMGEIDNRKFPTPSISSLDDSPKKSVEKPILKPKNNKNSRPNNYPNNRNNPGDGNNSNPAMQRPKPPKK